MPDATATAPPPVGVAAITVARLVEVLNQDGRAQGEPLPLYSLLADPRSVVLLGDPGMGKTTALKEAAAQPGSVYRSVRVFAPGMTACVPPGGTLLLDALDEAMAAGASDPLAALAARLHDLGQPRFWLSCRAVDWVGQGGAALLRDCAPSGLLVARLLPLDNSQITELAQSKGLDGTELLDAMREAGLVPLLRNPWTLNLVFEVAADGLPQSRYDLFERAAELLTRERSDRPGRGQAATAEMLDAAGAVCAVLLISGVNAITTGAGSAAVVSTAGFARLASQETVGTALRSRLFASVEEGAWEPQHRTLAEFLGARFLAGRIANHGLALRRVLALLRGNAPTPHPSLRGLFAWLATMLPLDRAGPLAASDPYGVLSYGDPALMASAVRRTLLIALGELAEREPWFRMHSWGEARFGALAVPELIPDLRGVLAERPVRPHLLSCACDALAEGEARPELAADLLALLTDTQVEVGVRLFAARAYLNASSAAPEAACALFRRLLTEPALDPGAQIAGYLLPLLYPKRLGTADLATFLDRWVEGNGNNDALLPYRLQRIIPDEAVLELLDALATRPWTNRQDAPPPSRLSEVQEIIGSLAGRALRNLPQADASRMIPWFKLLSVYPVKESKEYQEALAARGDLLPSLVVITSEGLSLAEVAQAPWLVFQRLAETLTQWQWPPDAAARLLSSARSETDPSRAARLFAAALDLGMGSARPSMEWFEDAWSFGTSQSGLQPILAIACAPRPIMPERQEINQQRRQAQAARDAGIAQQIGELEQRKAGILAGTELGWLGWLGARWFGVALAHVEIGNLSPPERLRALVPEAVAAAAEQGFRQLAQSGRVPPPTELADQAIRNSWPASDYAFLAGADLLFADAEQDLPPLPAERLTALLCLALARTTRSSRNGVEQEDGRAWVGRVAAAMPGESAQALRELIEPQLIAGCSHVRELLDVCRNQEFAPVRPLLVPNLFRLARQPDSFGLLANAALRVLPRDAVHGIALERLSQLQDAPTAEQWPWLHLAWRLKPEQHEDGIRAVLASDQGLHIELAEATGDTLAGGNQLPTPLTLTHRALILRVLGPLYPPVSLSSGGYGVPPSYQLGRVVQAQVDRLSVMPDAEAGALLAEVVADPAFAAHRDHALQSLAAWRREAHARTWEPPSASAVAMALQSGSPASAADLVAFAEEHLRDLNAALRRTEDNGWRGFWNTGAYGHTDAKVENFCRDQLVILLRGRFEQAGLGLATEVRHAGEDRCDVVTRALERTLPIEVKCDWHPELWTAWRSQLAERYACEPKAAGTGIYLVFWFGPERGGERRVKRAPGGGKPGNAAELEAMLSAMAVESGLPISVVVLDATPPKPRRDGTGTGGCSRRPVSARKKRSADGGADS